MQLSKIEWRRRKKQKEKSKKVTSETLHLHCMAFNCAEDSARSERAASRRRISGLSRLRREAAGGAALPRSGGQGMRASSRVGDDGRENRAGIQCMPTP